MSNRHDLSLDIDVLIDAAKDETGIAAFDDPTVADRAAGFVRAYKGLGMSAQDELTTAETILDVLVTRLKLGEDRRRYPEIADERIEKPVFVLGFGRSGTTLLYSLLSADPGARSPHWWDAQHPSPPPGLSPEHDDLRKQISQREVAQYLANTPIKKAHNFFVNGADMSLECYVLWGLDFRCITPFLFFRAPGYPNDLVLGGQDDSNQNMIDTYEFEKRMLQALQWRRPTGHWVLKDPTHHFFLPELTQVFPDATFVWTHRDPVQVFASLIELVSIMTGSLARREMNRRDVAKAVLHEYVASLDRVIRHPAVTAPNVIHVQYEETTKDSIGVGRRVYERMGRDFTPEVQRRIEEYRANPNNRSDLYGKFEYSLENTGFTADELREHFKDYIETFDIPSR